MTTLARIILAAFVAVLCGCAVRPRIAQAPAATEPATAPADPRAGLALDQIEPSPVPPIPATAPAGSAPLDAIELFAAAREARFRNQPFTAINLLEQAVKLDPVSFELNFALGSALQRVGSFDKAIDAYERAEALRPEDLVLQAELGRAYMQKGDTVRGIQHLRLARISGEYGADDAIAAAVDYRLGLALQQAGYDRAALEVYEQLLRRLQQPSSSMRGNPEVAYLINRPEFLVEQVAKLQEKQGQWDEALRAYQFIARRQPDDFNCNARVVNTLLSMGRTDDAISEAIEMVSRFRASPDSVTLLLDAYRKAGKPDAAIEQLRRLRAQRPEDRGILFALSDSLQKAGRGSEARTLLTDAARERNGDVEILSRLVLLQSDSGQLADSARVLIESTALRPQSASEILPLWTRLVSPGRKRTLHLADVQALPVTPDAQASKLFFQSRVAQSWNRAAVADSSLRQSVAARPIFAPAFRAMLDQIWTEPEWDETTKRQATGELIAAARAGDDAALADELAGLALLAQKRFIDAEKILSEAVRLRGADAAPDLALSRAAALRGAGNAPRFEQDLWRLVSDHPRYSPAYPVLFSYYVEQGNLNAARRVLSAWLTSMPDDADARLLEASVELRFNRRADEAERILLQLLREYPDRLDVLAALRLYFTESAKLSTYIELLEQERAGHPYNFTVVAQLVDVYAAQNRLPEATRVLDAARSALRDDPDRLYFIAHLYGRVDQPRLNEQVLEEVLRADPTFASAANDLGYTWAEAGRNLDRAEALIRGAVEAEPGNTMFLDSMGWVMYKRGRFDDARRWLERAVASTRVADPVILDHFGDALYRSGQTEAAARQWELALARIGTAEQRAQHNTLRLHLEQKLKQVESKQPVSVAPIAQTDAPGQATNQMRD